MSYYDVDYYGNPMPYYAGRSATRTVPGWGVLPRAAGNRRIGVGNAVIPAAIARLARVKVEKPAAAAPEEEWVPEAEKPALPWWIWIAIPGVLAGGLALAVNMGWIGGEAR